MAKVLTVKTCGSCPYSPKDLGDNYDPAAELFCCGRCPNQGVLRMETGPYYRDKFAHPERTNYAKRQEQLAISAA